MRKLIFVCLLMLSLMSSSFGQEVTRNRIKVETTGHVSVPADSIIITCNIFTSDEDPSKAEQRLTKRVKNFIEILDLPSIAPTTSFSIMIVRGPSDINNQDRITSFQPAAGWIPAQVTKVLEISFNQDIIIKFFNIQTIDSKLLSRKIAEVIQKLSDAIEATVDVTSPVIKFEINDPESLRKAAQKNAINLARSQAEFLAKLAERKLGKCVIITCVKEIEDFASDSSQINVYTTYQVEFELVDK